MKKIFISTVLLVFVTIVSGQTKSDKKKIKKEKAEKEYVAIKKMIDSKAFVFEGDWANPTRGTMINLIGNANYLKISKDSVDVYLPYFGVLHSAVNYGSGGGLKFNTLFKNYSVKYNDKKKRVRIKFESKNKSELFNMMLDVYGGGSASLSVSGSHRNSISYNGVVSEVKKEED